jgi:hypothetical protein
MQLTGNGMNDKMIGTKHFERTEPSLGSKR